MQAGRSAYRGGGRRGGGGPFRGGGRGNFGPRYPFRGGGSGPPFHGGGRGRGRGRGGSRRFAPNAASSSSPSHPESAAVEDAELNEEDRESSGVPPEEAGEDVVLAETSPSKGAPSDSAPNWQPSQVAWCELCRVDCTSLEILEQHKNGKRHKKNLQRIADLKNTNLTEPEGDSNSQPEIAREGEEENDEEGEENPENNLPSEAISNENEPESGQQNDIVEQPEKPMEERSDSQICKPKMEHHDNWRHGMKRRMRGGRGGKRMKMYDAPRRPTEASKPKVVIPLICDLCNVKCDTQEVFDRHLSGKKHIAKLKRFEGHQAMYGPVGLQVLYPPNPIAQTLLHPQGHQQQGFYGPPSGSFPPQGPYMPHQAHQAVPPSAGAGAQFQQNAISQGSEVHLVPGDEADVSVAPQPQQQLATTEYGSKELLTVEVNHMIGISESGGNGQNPRQDNSVTTVEQVYAGTHEAGDGVTTDHVDVPGLDSQPKEGVAE